MSITEMTSHIDDNLSLDAIRLSQNFADDLAVKRKLTVVPITKPNSSWWVRLHSELTFQIETTCLEDRENNHLYLVMPEVRQQLSDEAKVFRLFTAINRQGNVFLWPIKIPNTDSPEGRMERYFQSVCSAVTLAKDEWIRVKWNKNLGAYDTLRTDRKLPDPEWPEESFQEIISIAFRNLVITSLDHPLVERLLHGD